jgi:hypothetical protein
MEIDSQYNIFIHRLLDCETLSTETILMSIDERLAFVLPLLQHTQVSSGLGIRTATANLLARLSQLK